MTHYLRTTVSKGDTLTHIADLGSSVKDITALAANNIQNANLITVGQSVFVPMASLTHAVKAGETLTSISKKYHVTLASLIDANSGINPNVIAVVIQRSWPTMVTNWI